MKKKEYSDKKLVALVEDLLKKSGESTFTTKQIRETLRSSRREIDILYRGASWAQKGDNGWGYERSSIGGVRFTEWAWDAFPDRIVRTMDNICKRSTVLEHRKEELCTFPSKLWDKEKKELVDGTITRHRHIFILNKL